MSSRAPEPDRMLRIAFFFLLALPALAQTPVDNPLLPSGYHQFRLAREDGSYLNFYTNFEALDPARPLAIWMQGSGYHSLFPVRDGRANLGPMGIVSQALGKDIQCLSVEKRGVEFGLVGGGTAESATAEYLAHATLEDRSQDVLRVLACYKGLPTRLLAIGHSEGADVAARVAADQPLVTHVAFLAGGGASQLYEFLLLIRKSEPDPERREEQIAQLWKDWADIEANPRSTVHFFRGHAYRRWASFMRAAPLDSLLKTRAKILMLHGTEDTSVPIESADLTAVELSRHNRVFQYVTLKGADHSLLTPEQREKKAIPFADLGARIRAFFLDQP